MVKPTISCEEYQHFQELRTQTHCNRHLQASFNKYGKDAFVFNKLLEIDCTADEINRLEEEYVAKYDAYENGYNENRGD